LGEEKKSRVFSKEGKKGGQFRELLKKGQEKTALFSAHDSAKEGGGKRRKTHKMSKGKGGKRLKLLNHSL